MEGFFSFRRYSGKELLSRYFATVFRCSFSFLAMNLMLCPAFFNWKMSMHTSIEIIGTPPFH